MYPRSTVLQKSITLVFKNLKVPSDNNFSANG